MMPALREAVVGGLQMEDQCGEFRKILPYSKKRDAAQLAMAVICREGKASLSCILFKPNLNHRVRPHQREEEQKTKHNTQDPKGLPLILISKIPNFIL